MEDKVYICIDLKSFYASVECVLRNLNPLTTNLVVADISRTEKTICLAVSPSLKSFGIPGRDRLFNVVSRVKEVNKERFKKNNYKKLIKKSFDINELNSHKDYELDYIVACPQMATYIEFSARIYNVYLKYVAKEDIHVYSIDEVFMDVTKYLKALEITPYELAKKIIMDVLNETGITATAGIGTNMYLAKVAMDIVAKHIPADEYGVRVAELDEMKYRKLLWDHVPLTDFWRVGPGIATRLNNMGIYTMGDIALCSVGKQDEYFNEEILYKEFGINAELLIDHAWGYEPTTMEDIKNYKPNNHCLSVGQVLHEPYTFEKGKLILKEMVDSMSLDLVEKGLVGNQISIYIGYDSSSATSDYKGELSSNYYGRKEPKASHGGINLDGYTSSTSKLTTAAVRIYEHIVNPKLLIRRINVGVNNVISEEEAKLIKKDTHLQLNLFSDYSTTKSIEQRENKKLEKEKRAQKAIIDIKKKYGKNSILKGINLEEGSTMKDRNEQIGGHKA